MIKVVAPALRHPDNRGLAEFHNYWGESHGPLFANTKVVRRYVQHLTLHDAYGINPAPTFDGVSMFWYDDLESQRVLSPPPRLLDLLHAVMGVDYAADEPAAAGAVPEDPEAIELVRAVLEDDCQLFDRSITWPMHHKRAFVVAEEHVIVDGPPAPEMVKAIFIGSKRSGLTLGEFLARWRHGHGSLVARVPGLRRYVQNHALPAAYADRGQTHDGWSELWFDDLGSLHAAVDSPEWAAAEQDGRELFSEDIGVGVARERVQKDLDWTYKDWGVGQMSEADVHDRLVEEGFADLAADPDAPRLIKAAAAAQALAVWTPEHLVTIDASALDARPRR